eukprot:4662052-Pleurochrysis_carterae.AAC.3
MPALSPVCGPGTCTSNVQEECFFDPGCGVAGVDQLGCNAGGRPQCRFCGFQGGIPCPASASARVVASQEKARAPFVVANGAPYLYAGNPCFFGPNNKPCDERACYCLPYGLWNFRSGFHLCAVQKFSRLAFLLQTSKDNIRVRSRFEIYLCLSAKQRHFRALAHARGEANAV